MSKLKEFGFEKNEDRLVKGWIKYSHEDGYNYHVKRFGQKLVVLDNYSITPIVVSKIKLDENNILESLLTIYGTNLIKNPTGAELEDLIKIVSKEVYEEALILLND